MSESDSQPLDLLELAYLPAEDPQRQAFEAQVRGMAGEERDHWLAILRESDELRTALQHVPVPVDVEQLLLEIPSAAKPPQRIFGLSLNWKAVAAAVLILIGLWKAQQWYFTPPPLQRLDDQTSARIAALAVKEDQQAAGKTQITSDSLAMVQSALNADGFSFPPMVLKPSNKMKLIGGGKTDFNGVPVAYTRWEDATGICTVYQMDGTKLNLPRLFLTTTVAPQEPGSARKHYRVPIWACPDGKCAWVLVLNNDRQSDGFSQTAY